METDLIKSAPAPLSSEEESAWEFMVEEGRRLREPLLERKKARNDAKMEEYRRRAEARGQEFKPWKVSSSSDSMKEIPVECKRWMVLRMAGVPFRKAGESSGATWLQLQDARAHSEDFRCAGAAMEESSRQLMKAKAQSIVERSQDEDAKVSMAQTQVSMRILENLDRDHFGEREETAVADEVQKQLSGGGFVINLIGDAARVAEAPVRKPGKALVYADV